jgi:hypothetical protein
MAVVLATDDASWIALGISALALLVTVIGTAMNVRTSRRALSISEAEHRVRESERAARGQLRMNIDVPNMAFDPADNAYVSEGDLAYVRLRIEIQNTGGRDAGPGGIEIDVPTAISDSSMRWTDAGGNEIREASQRAARTGDRNVLYRTVDLIGRDVGRIVFVTLPRPCQTRGSPSIPFRCVSLLRAPTRKARATGFASAAVNHKTHRARGCEHAFVSIKGSPYTNFRRSLETRKLSIVLAAAAELRQVNLGDALEILVLMAQENDPRFDRAAARWIGRLLAERRLGLADARWALALVERLPGCAETLRRLAGYR